MRLKIRTILLIVASLLVLLRTVQIRKPFGARAPLLVQEGWREAPGWSLTDNRSDSIPTAFLSATTSLLLRPIELARSAPPSAPFKGCFAAFSLGHVHPSCSRRGAASENDTSL